MSGDGSAGGSGGLPSGWCWAKLGELGDLRDDLRVPVNADERRNRIGPYPYYGANGQVGVIDEYRYEGEHVLLAEDGGYFDQPERGVAYRVDGRFWVNNHAHVMRPNGAMIGTLFVHQLNRVNWLDYVSGTTRLKLTQASMRNVMLKVPPMAEQKRIVAKLDDLLARSRATREALSAIPPLLERYRHSVLAAAFRGELTLEWRPESGISTSWANVSLGEVLKDVRYGTSKKCAYEPIDVPVLRIPNVVGGFVSRRDLKYAAFDEAEKRQLGLRDGDVLMIRSNGSLGLVGRTAVTTEADEGSLYAGYLIRLRADRERCNPRYLSLYLGAPVARARIENTARSTSGVNNINAEEIRGFPLPLPPLPEQHEIVRRVDAAFARIAAVRQLVEAQLARLDALDRSILARAFRGELVPQDPSDEPAAALLDRIRAERAAAPAKKPARRGRPAAV